MATGRVRSGINKHVNQAGSHGAVINHKPHVFASHRNVYTYVHTMAFFNQVPEETSPYLPPGAQDQRLGAELDQLPCGSTGTSSGNCSETETCLARACHTPREPPQNHPSGHLGGWATPWSAEEMVDGQHQRVDIPAHAIAANKGLLQKRLEGDRY